MPPKRSSRFPRVVRFYGHLLTHGPGIVCNLAIAQLHRLANRSDHLSAPAAETLAHALCFNLKSGPRKRAAGAISTLVSQDAVDAAWKIWLATRNSDLFSALQSLNRLARLPIPARIYSSLITAVNPNLIIASAGDDSIATLAEAAVGPNPVLSVRALEALRLLNRSAAIDACCITWAESRHPILETLIIEKNWLARKPANVRVLTCLINNQLDKVFVASAEMVDSLVAACTDANQILAARAQSCLPLLQTQAAIDALCLAWHSTRHELLETAILQAHYLPTNPLSLRLKVGIKTGRKGLLLGLSPHAVTDYLESITDSDPIIRARAMEQASDLSPEARDEICRLAIYSGSNEALSVVLQHDLRPTTLTDQALLLFLQERWADYALLDFDRRILETAYTAAPEGLRKRIAARIRSAGKPEFLSILSDGDRRLHSGAFSPEEADIWLSILSANRDYANLWKQIPFLSLRHAIRALRTLAASNWHPDTASDQDDLGGWIALAQSLPEDPARALKSIPWALPCASLRVRGRINAVSFSSYSSHLAIATAERRLVIWDYAAAEVRSVMGPFDHSLSQVVYVSSDLYIAERSLAGTPSSIYRCSGDHVQRLGQHQGSVTMLLPLNPNRLISTGRDGVISIWNSTLTGPEKSAATETWPRSALISPDQSILVTLAEKMQVWELPDLHPVPVSPFRRFRAAGYRASPLYAADFTPDNRFLLVGQANGRVLAYGVAGSDAILPRALLTTHPGAVKKVAFLNQGTRVITAGVEGQIKIFSWPEMSQIAQIELPEGRLSSLRISPDGSFMAAGGSEAELSLWDLRTEFIQNLLLQPLAVRTPADLSSVGSLSKNPALSADLNRCFLLLSKMLRYRFRYDVLVEDTHSIQPGQFDILL